jgi:hypothetical protein
MKKNTLLKLILFLFCLPVFVTAQNKKDKANNLTLTQDNVRSIEETGFIRCYTTEAEEQLRKKHPNRATAAEFENWLAPKIKKTIERQKNAKTMVIKTIPVIFHVFTDGNNTVTNLTQAQIQAQLDQLNIDYGNTAGSSYSVAADTEVRFCLAQQDVDGLQLDEIGINRITSYGDGPFSQADYQNTMKAATQWDPTKYMNIWCSNLTGGLLGYAQFPEAAGLAGIGTGNGVANTDGVVILSSSVGSIANPNPNGGNYTSGRTLTHEVGHWLGLRHIWGDGNCSVDDFCADTPAAGGSNFGCPTNDSCTTDSDNDMVENYMDYTDDTCMDTFTADQATRITTVMDNSVRRMELASSIACQPGQTFDMDGKIEIDNLNIADCSDTIAPSIILTNKGNNPLVTATIDYYIDNNTATTHNWVGNLTTGASETIILPSITIPEGANHTFSAQITSVNSSTDQNTSNNLDVSSPFAAYFDTAQLLFELTTDNYGSETTWEFKDSNNTVLYSGGPYTDDENETINETFSVTNGECYSLTINDSYGDGICCAYGIGSYSLKNTNNDILFAGGEFENTETTQWYINQEAASVDVYDFENQISIYPNPANNVLNIKVSDNNIPDSYKIYNMLGQLIKAVEINATPDLTINTSAFSNGMYFIKIAKDNNSISIPFIKE